MAFGHPKSTKMKNIKGWQIIQIFGIIFAMGLILGVLGCVASNRTKISWWDGKVVTITSPDKAMVTVQIGSDKVTVDSRSSSMLRDAFSLMLAKELQNPVVNR